MSHPYFDAPRPHVLAHRGGSGYGSENSLDAFRTALSLGATHIETDVRMTRDGVLVLFHDSYLTDGKKTRRISRLNFAELNSIARRMNVLRSGSSFTTLNEALLALPSARFNIDVKAWNAASPCGELVSSMGAEMRVLLTSFSARRRRRALRSAPFSATSASAWQATVSILSARCGLHRLAVRLLRSVDAVQLPTRVLGQPTFTSRFVRVCIAAGAATHAWTINDPLEMKQLIALGVDGVVTDEVSLAVASFRDDVA